MMEQIISFILAMHFSAIMEIKHKNLQRNLLFSNYKERLIEKHEREYFKIEKFSV